MYVCASCAKKNSVCCNTNTKSTKRCHFCKQAGLTAPAVPSQSLEDMMLPNLFHDAMYKEARTELLNAIVLTLRSGKGIITLHGVNRLADEIVKEKKYSL